MHREFETTSLEEWSHGCSLAYVPEVVTGPPTFRGQLQESSSGTFAVTRASATPSLVSRDAKLIAREPRESLLLAMAIRSGVTTLQGGRESVVLPGHAHLFDSDKPFSVRIDQPNEMLILRLPRSGGNIPDRLLDDSMNRVLRPTPGLAILHRYTQRVLDEPSADPADKGLPEPSQREAVATELLGSLLHSLTYGHRSRPVVSGPAIVASALWFLEEHHSDSSLAIADVASWVHTSRRYLEHQFALRGLTPAGELRRLRLAHARELLLTGPPQAVHRIASLSGFPGTDTFIRAFKRHYGATPAQYRAARADSPATASR